MDVWEKNFREDQIRNVSREQNPSFSSTLLDAIYRSIDESNGKGDEEMIFYRENMRKKREQKEEEKDKMDSMRRACTIERWMEKKVSCEKVVVRRKSMADFDRKQMRNGNINNKNQFDNSALLLNSNSSSSESSCGGGFSSSESDSVYGLKSRSSSCYSIQKLKPIRTSILSWPVEKHGRSRIGHDHPCDNQKTYVSSQKTESEGSLVKTKSKALKIYSDLKKVKQPISPGGRLASFLNSLFTAGNAKKAKISSVYEERKLKTELESTCSSASSFSRSCLTKTPSSRGKLSNNGMKRSVRFYPVSVIVDEDCRPCGHKNLYENEKLQYHVMSESQRVEEAVRELLKNYHQKKKTEEEEEEFDDDEEDDAASYASSDLFELDNLSAIGIERYREELPVYETTHLDTNRAIASGLIL